MVCAWLLYRYTDATPSEAIDLFALMRTNQIRSDQYQGIETYSQRRYVEYFWRFIQNPELLRTPPFKVIAINRITVGPLFTPKSKTKRSSSKLSSSNMVSSKVSGSKHSVSNPSTGSASDFLSNDDNLEDVEWIARVIQRDETSMENVDKSYLFGTGTLENDIDLNGNFIRFEKGESVPALCGNICVKILKRKESESTVFASFWIHTYFLEIAQDAKGQQMVIPKLECDILHKDKTHKVAPSEMTIALDYDTMLCDDPNAL